MRSSAAAILIDDSTIRRSLAIGWRHASILTVWSCTAASSASTLGSSAITSSAACVSPSRTAASALANWLSVRPPISLIVALRRSSSWSKRLRMWSLAMSDSSWASAEPAGDIGLRALVAGGGEYLFGDAELDQLAEIHEGGEVGHACRLLHVVGDDHDRVVLLQLVHQLLDLRGRDRIERRARLVEQDHFGLHRDRAGDAKPLLLPAREAEPAGVELVLDLVPQRGAPQRRLDARIEFGSRQLLVESDAEGDVLVDRHRERRRLLEHHADARP